MEDCFCIDLPPPIEGCIRKGEISKQRVKFAFMKTYRIVFVNRGSAITTSRYKVFWSQF